MSSISLSLNVFEPYKHYNDDSKDGSDQQTGAVGQTAQQDGHSERNNCGDHTGRRSNPQHEQPYKQHGYGKTELPCLGAARPDRCPQCYPHRLRQCHRCGDAEVLPPKARRNHDASDGGESEHLDNEGIGTEPAEPSELVLKL